MVDKEKGELHIIWDVDDIQHYAACCLAGTHMRLSRDEALKVLHRLDRSHDPNQGVTWEIVEKAILEYLGEREAYLRRAAND